MNSSSKPLFSTFHIPGTFLSALLTLTHFILSITLWDRCCYSPHFTDGETGQRQDKVPQVTLEWDRVRLCDGGRCCAKCWCSLFGSVFTATLRRNITVSVLQGKKRKFREVKPFPKVTQLVSDGLRLQIKDSSHRGLVSLCCSLKCQEAAFRVVQVPGLSYMPAGSRLTDAWQPVSSDWFGVQGQSGDGYKSSISPSSVIWGVLTSARTDVLPSS